MSIVSGRQKKRKKEKEESKKKEKKGERGVRETTIREARSISVK